ncbi:TPA: hypothetical protein N0F65_001029 [Lagenidium giganteum]|uniref:Retroviral polymerase SH3-like domain-containing protein n=1 Tax=Lagenidium giganteum TaxID=4803 RepID=A0AAV2YWS8_9STRA|nr:TPA: hypothetical protein N0F65_001029 [Lagenidium giganteum]
MDEGTLMDFHERLGHIAFDAVETIASDPASGIRLTNSAEGKQSKNNQPKVDSGANAPIDRVGGVVCSDLKGPVTPRDRHGNRYAFREFLRFFERRARCKVHVLRTDGGGECRVLDAFCADTGIARQVSEPQNQASNGKAERMHRTMFAMARCMLFASELTLTYWGDALEFATKSPIEMLTGEAPKMSGILAFGSRCMARMDPGHNALAKRAVEGFILGKNDETKGYKVLIMKTKKTITTQHIQQVQSMNEEQNKRLREQLAMTRTRETTILNA